MSGLASCWAIIPVKAPGQGKSRLAEVLSPAERAALVAAMLGRVVEAARSCPAIAKVALVSPSDHGFAERVTLLPDAAGTLNGALVEAVAALRDAPAKRLLVIAADLPGIDARDVAMLANAADASVAIAPDRHGSGTNALSLPWAAAARFRFAFGPGSHARHRAEADRLGFAVETILSAGLENDVDVPADLADARSALTR